MGSTHANIQFHVVFSAKSRANFIASQWRPDLHAYLGGCAREAGAVALEIGGTSDHVHLLLGLRPKHVLANVVRDIKRGSSRWVHETIGFAGFGWQEEYGAFSVSYSNAAGVREYIANQDEHHKTWTYQQEYLGLLKKHAIEFDERYVFER